MSLQIKDVEFNIGTGAVASTVDVTGFGFQPKAVLFFAIGRSESTDAGGNANTNRMVGWAAQTTEGGGTKQHCLGSASEDGALSGSADSGHYLANNACVLALDVTGNPDGAASATSWLADGVRLTIDNQFSINQRVLALGIGGSDIVNVEASAFATPTVGTEPFDQQVTTGFACVDNEAVAFFLQPRDSLINNNAVDSSFGFGCAVAPGEEFSTIGMQNDQNASTTSTIRALSNVLCTSSPNGAGSSLVRRAQFGGWHPTDGFNLTWTSINAVDARIAWLVLKGGKWAIRDALTKTGLSTTVIDTLGFTPLGGLVVGVPGALTGGGSTAIDLGDRVSYGIFSGASSRRCVAMHDANGVTTSAAATRIEHDAVLAHIANDGSVIALMDVQSLDSDGVTFVMDDADTAENAFMVLLGGNTGGGGGGGGGKGYAYRLRRRR